MGGRGLSVSPVHHKHYVEPQLPTPPSHARSPLLQSAWVTPFHAATLKHVHSSPHSPLPPRHQCAAATSVLAWTHAPSPPSNTAHTLLSLCEGPCRLPLPLAGSPGGEPRPKQRRGRGPWPPDHSLRTPRELLAKRHFAQPSNPNHPGAGCWLHAPVFRGSVMLWCCSPTGAV